MKPTAIYLPPLAQKSGGLAVLMQIGNILHSAGFPVRFVTQEKAEWLAESAGITLVVEKNLSQVPLAEGEIWLIPEGWPSALMHGLQNPQAKTVLYVQNWAYLLTEQTESLPFSALPVQFLAVSDPVASFIMYLTGKTAPVLRPGINTSLFCPIERHAGKNPVIAYMPRKNKVLARQIRSIVNARRAFLHKSTPIWKEIQGLPSEGVAKILQTSDVFLATGFPEGCPLPPLEAMACGCLCVGFSGFGGLDYMRDARNSPNTIPPLIFSRDIPPNGLWVPDADIHAAAIALEYAMDMLENKNEMEALHILRQNAIVTAAKYSTQVQIQHVLSLWQSLCL